ncbi:MAG: hypothetical protein KDC27_06605 [Acidobacteria bacterium]|nr:hypothetical protein [Acidobacteriota bacterium]
MPGTIRALVNEFLANLPAPHVGPREWDALLATLTRTLGDARRINPAYVLDLLHQTQVEVDRSLGGLPLDLRGQVHASSPEAAAESLLAMSAAYAKARQSADVVRAEDIRRAVRQAKDRLRLTLRRTNLRPETRQAKEALLEWFLVWLENPLVFPAWLDAQHTRTGPDA